MRQGVRDKNITDTRANSSTAELSHEGSHSRIPFTKGCLIHSRSLQLRQRSRSSQGTAEAQSSLRRNLSWGNHLSRSHSQHSFAAEFVSREPLAAELVSEPLPEENWAQSHSQQNLSRNHSQQNSSQNHSQQKQSRCLGGTTRSRTCLEATGSIVSQQNLSRGNHSLVSATRELGSKPLAAELVSEPLATELVSEPLATEPVPVSCGNHSKAHSRHLEGQAPANAQQGKRRIFCNKG